MNNDWYWWLGLAVFGPPNCVYAYVYWRAFIGGVVEETVKRLKGQ